MSGTTLFLVILLLVIVIVVRFCVVKVPDNQDFILERKGKFYKVLSRGVYIINPFNDKVIHKCSLEEDTIDLKPIKTATEDGHAVTMTATITLKVANAKNAYYGVDNYKTEAAKAAAESLYNAVSNVELEHLEDRRAYMEKHTQRNVNKTSMSWGVTTVLVEIMQIEY